MITKENLVKWKDYLGWLSILLRGVVHCCNVIEISSVVDAKNEV